MTIPPTHHMPPRMANTHMGPNSQGDQHWQPEQAGVRVRDMIGQPPLSEMGINGMNPQIDDLGGMNEGFEPLGPPHTLGKRGRGGPHKKRGRQPPSGFDGFSDPDPSFSLDGVPPPFQPPQEDFSTEAMLNAPHGGHRGMRHDGNMNMMHQDPRDIGTQGGNNMDMDRFDIGPPRHLHQDGGFGGPQPFDEIFNPGPSPGSALRPALRRREAPIGDNTFPPPEDFGRPRRQGGGGDYMAGPEPFADDPQMYSQEPDMDMDFELNEAPHRDTRDPFSDPPGQPLRRQRRASDSLLPAYQDNDFQQSGRGRDHSHARPGRPREQPFEDDDSAQYFGSDPTEYRAHRRVSHEDEQDTLPPYSPQPGRQKRILFYSERKPYYGFTNRAPYSVRYGGKRYPTAEHLYHALKFEHHHPEIAERIRTCSSPNAAISEARRYQSEIRSDWRHVKKRKMEEIVAHKFDQHSRLRDELLGTGDAELVEASYNDPFWGVGSNGVGQNEFGRVLVKLRTELRGTRRRRTSPPRTRARAMSYDRDRAHDSRRSVYFYGRNQPHYGFSNYSTYPVVYQGRRYPTSQHLFQAMKFLDHVPELAERIRKDSAYPDIATAEAHRHSKDVRRDWKFISTSMMEEALWHKFDQHTDLKRELLDTGDTALMFDSREDATWGVGHDGRGRNELGHALERVRSKLRREPRSRSRQARFDVPYSEFGQRSHRDRSLGPAKLTRRHSRGPSLPNIMTGLFGGRRSKDQITFDHKSRPYYGFSNLAPFAVTYKGKIYPTAEHLFQSFKFEKNRPDLAELIRTCSSDPFTAISEARNFSRDVRGDWRSVNGKKMEEALWSKFTQHRRLGDSLMATGDAELIEENERDSYWGIGPDGRGRNEFGKALEKVRLRLQR